MRLPEPRIENSRNPSRRGSEQAARTQRQKAEQQTESDGRRPGGANERRRHVLYNAEKQTRNERPRQRAKAAHDDDGEEASNEDSPRGGIDRLDHDQRAASQGGKRDRQGKRDSLHPNRIDAHQPQRFAVLRNRCDRTTEKSRLQEDV